MKLSQKLAYGVGHVLNDICSALWFNYCLLFFEVVLKMPATIAGGLICLGQVTNALASPVVGVLVDRYSTKKLWHLLGTVMIVFTYVLIFSDIPWISEVHIVTNVTAEWKTPWETFSPFETASAVTYYSVVIAVFQIGWTIVQLAHLAIITDITPDSIERANLTAIRFTFFIITTMVIYVITWFVLRITNSETALGPQDAYKFKTIVLISFFVGAVCLIWFQVVLDIPSEKEKPVKEEYSKTSSRWSQVYSDYFKHLPLYQITFLYFASRMLSSISLVYLPIYLVETIKKEPEYIAIIPLVASLGSLVASGLVKPLRAYLSSETNFLLGSLIGIAACVWFRFGFTYSAELFIVAILLGIGITITAVASLCLCAELIGTDTKNGAFVYSIVTGVDKFFGGFVIIIIEQLKTGYFNEASNFHRDVLAYGCGGFIVFGITVLLPMYCGSSNLKSNENESLKEGKKSRHNSDNKSII